MIALSRRLIPYSLPLLVFLVGCVTTGNVSHTPAAEIIGKGTRYRPAERISPRHRAVSAPQMLTRQQWGARSPMLGRLDPMGRVFRITIHHEGMERHNITRMSEVAERLRRTQISHMRGRGEGGLGAGDIGYHFCIDRAGRLWEGRLLKYQGAHAGNGSANRGNIGIELMGNFNEQQVGRSQLAALEELLVYLMSKYRIGPDRVYTHREIKALYGLGSTDCPGRNLQMLADQLRNAGWRRSRR